MNYYELLEVSPNAGQEVLKAAYKSLMQRYHPDKNPGNVEAAAHSALVIQAYGILSDSNKRAAYDIELKRQLENLNNIQDRLRKVQAPVFVVENRSKPGGYLWLLIIFAALAVWYVGMPSAKKPPSGSVAKEAASLIENAKSDISQNKAIEPAPVRGQKTIPLFFQDIDVTLEAAADATDVSAEEVRHVLTIPTIGVVVGAFDSNAFIAFMEDNKKFISQKLSVKLAGVKYETLLKAGGAQYLKQIILDSIGEITGSNRDVEYPSTGTESPAHYGVVDILLSDSFTVKTLKTVKQQANEGNGTNLP